MSKQHRAGVAEELAAKVELVTRIVRSGGEKRIRALCHYLAKLEAALLQRYSKVHQPMEWSQFKEAIESEEKQEQCGEIIALSIRRPEFYECCPVEKMVRFYDGLARFDKFSVSYVEDDRNLESSEEEEESSSNEDDDNQEMDQKVIWKSELDLSGSESSLESSSDFDGQEDSGEESSSCSGEDDVSESSSSNDDETNTEEEEEEEEWSDDDDDQNDYICSLGSESSSSSSSEEEEEEDSEEEAKPAKKRTPERKEKEGKKKCKFM